MLWRDSTAGVFSGPDLPQPMNLNNISRGDSQLSHSARIPRIIANHRTSVDFVSINAHLRIMISRGQTGINRALAFKFNIMTAFQR